MCLPACVRPQPAALPGAVLARDFARSPVWLIDVASGEPKLRLDLREARLDGSVTRDGMLYVASRDALNVHRLSDGKLLFRHEHRDGYLSPYLAVDDRHVYALSEPSTGNKRNPEIIAIDRKRYDIRWTLPVGSNANLHRSDSAPALAHGLLLVPTGATLVAIDPVAVKVVWVFRTNAALRWPTSAGPNIFVVADDGIIHAIDPETGNERWRHVAGKASALGGGRWKSRPMRGVADALVYFDGESLVALDPSSRAVRWRRGGGNSAVLGAHLGLLRLDERQVAALDLESGDERWRATFQHGTNAPVIADHDAMVLVRPYGDELHAYDAADGKLRWKFDLADGELERE
jgi:outer membrane protein assembly factor BamB